MAKVDVFSYNYYVEEEIDVTQLKYALYARKSQADESRQVRSIPDQVDECRDLAKRLHLQIVEPPITEEQSAKKPHKRPLFRQMINDIKNGKYDAILSWNPDRLARNMLEGGEIIDLVDQEIIKDLKFVTHHFTQDANGKMLLGMAFVLSKQYSDKLSQDVKRGVDRNFMEGKTPTPKHGYTRDENGLYRPDGKKFDLIKEIWHMRAEGTSFEQIVKFLEQNGYSRQTKTGRTIKMTMQMLTDLFKDPFYYGILINKTTGEKVDLRTIYNFQPAISEDIYTKIQELSYRKIFPYKGKKTTFYPLKMMVICSFCGSNMYVGASTGHGGRYLNARCGNKLCKRHNKSIRMKIVFDFIYKFLDEGLHFTENEYKRYYDNLSNLNESKRELLAIDLHSKQAIFKRVDGDLTERSLNIVKLEKGSEMWRINEEKVGELATQKQSLDTEIAKLKERLATPAEQLSLENFLNLSKNASRIVQSANAVVKDQICRLIFLNLTVDDEKVLSYQAKEPFATLLKQRELLSSADERS